ncbi:aldehyde dehydrogenase family protein [Nocardia yamanashiensis]|uniref:aldehyde dehydrogenase family protein n=1 Tax=Nocardia yamanashiensis TaxID=209247 RepID=UPI001E635C20|nr:aldehyde dehydrogenase family protein [Nocardia yamanashiensis]UGT38841.1 aldehyde dehydrogenase family protein [Nocardia yamanashiensis]
MTTTEKHTTPASFEVRSPIDGSLVQTVAEQSAEQVAAAVRTLRQYQPAWEALGPKGRAEWLCRLRDWLFDHADEVADVIQSESGKTRAEALMEVPLTAGVINYYTDNAEKFLAPEHPGSASALTVAKRYTVEFRPYAVVGVITPWNYPLATPGFDVPPALIAGAAVLLKPSEVTPLSALLMARAWREIGAPPVFAVVTGHGETGAALVDSVDYVQFTGSTRTGQLVAHRAVDRLIPYSLELGGKDPAIVLADADLDRAAAGITWGALFNSGQVCVSIERVYVEAPVYDEFVAKLTANVEALRQGGGDTDFRYDVGAMATAAQRDLVERHVTEAISAGACALTGGKPTGTGTFFEPTVLVDVDHTMSCIREETFGPTIPVIRVADADEAIRLANDSVYGLSATVWTGDRDRGLAIARRIEAGAVNINDVFYNLMSPTAPHGGWKASGTGTRFGGAHGVRKYTREQVLTAPRLPEPTHEPLWFPYAPTRMRVVHRALRLITARDLRRRLGL